MMKRRWLCWWRTRQKPERLWCSLARAGYAGIQRTWCNHTSQPTTLYMESGAACAGIQHTGNYDTSKPNQTISNAHHTIYPRLCTWICRHWTHYVPWYITTHPVPYILYLHPWPPPYSRWEWIFQRMRDLVGFSENAGGGKVKLTANRGRAQFVLPWIFREDRRILEEGTYSQ